MQTIRAAESNDHDAIDQLLRETFGGADEADLVSHLRANSAMVIELVCERGGMIVGHIAFSTVTAATSSGLGLAPLAVAPSVQRQGIGATLVRASLERCRELGCGFVVVLGHPEYYTRFGFVRALDIGLTNDYGADDAFMVLALTADGMPTAGRVRYGPEFGVFEAVAGA